MKMNTDEDRAYKILANRYVKQIGDQLNQKMAEENITGLPMPQNKKRRKSKRVLAAGAAVAAALVLLITGHFSLLKYTEKLREEDSGPTENIKPVLTLSGDRFKMTGHMEDRGSDVYLIEDPMKDHAVITIETGSLDPTGMRLGKIYGNSVYYKAGQGYNILLYNTDNYIITLSCRYEFDTLTELYKNLLITF